MQQLLFVMSILALNASTQLSTDVASQTMQPQQMTKVSTWMIQQQIQFACPLESRADGTTKVVSLSVCLSRLQKMKQVIAGDQASNQALKAIDEFIDFHRLQ